MNDILKNFKIYLSPFISPMESWNRGSYDIVPTFYIYFFFLFDGYQIYYRNPVKS